MTTRNRGKQSSDDKLFAPKWHPIFTEAINDLSYLLTRGYAENSALQIVGNHYKLNKRQRNAVMRMSCSAQSITNRHQSESSVVDLKGQIVELDGFNILILLESILSGAFILKGRDGLYRDISSVHGSYKRVLKTEQAILLIGNALKELQIQSAKWYFDQPVSNSGRLKTRLLEISEAHQFNWQVELAFNPDKILAESQHIIISSDGWILDNAQRWFNLGAYIIKKYIEAINLIEA